jgi:hypothetical protein
MGFNPHRVHRRSGWDYLMVASALIICALVVLWAALG